MKDVVYEAYRNLLKAITGYDLEFYRNNDTVLRIENKELCFYEKFSCGSTPRYEKAKCIPLTNEECRLLESLLAMKQDIEKVNYEHKLKDLETMTEELNKIKETLLNQENHSE